MFPLARRFRVFLPLSLVCVAAFACGVRLEGEEEIVVRRGGDLVGGGGTLVLFDSVPGDAMLAGGSIEFTGSTGGDYLGAGGDQTISGRIGGSVRAAGGRVRLEAEVGRNATVAGGNVVVADGALVEGNAYLAGGAVRVEGGVNRLLRIAGGEVVLDGPLGGDVRVEAERLRVGPRAAIAGDLRYRVAEEAAIDPAARIDGRVVELPPGPDRRKGFGFLRALWLLGFLVAGCAAVALFPRTARSAEEAVRRRPFAAAGFGILWILAGPVAAVLVALTVVGLPLALIFSAIYVVLLYLGRAVVAIWLGRLALRAPEGAGRAGLLARLLIGGAALLLVGLMPVLGALVTLVATVMGIGALLAALSARAPAPAPGSLGGPGPPGP